MIKTRIIKVDSIINQEIIMAITITKTKTVIITIIIMMMMIMRIKICNHIN